MARTNKCFRYALNPEQGIGFHEITGDSFPFPEAHTGATIIEDTDGQTHQVVFDYGSGKFHDITTFTGPSDTSFVRKYKDGCPTSGVGGTDIVPQLKFGEDIGELERFFIRNNGESIYTRPQDETKRNATGYDANGYISGLEFDLTQFVDGNAQSSLYTAENITLPKHEIVFDKEAEGHRLQLKVTANKSEHKIVGRTSNYIVFDRKNDNDTVGTTEDTWQKNLGSPVNWLTKGSNQRKCRVDGLVKDGAYTATTGPDTIADSAMIVSVAIPIENDSVNNGTILFWGKSEYQGYGFNGLSMTVVGTSGNWSLYYSTGAIPADLELPATDGTYTGYIFDFRLYNTVIDANTRLYLFNNTIVNSGFNVLGVM